MREKTQTLPNLCGYYFFGNWWVRCQLLVIPWFWLGILHHITIYHTVSLERHPRNFWCWKSLCLSMVEGPCTYSLFWWIDITWYHVKWRLLPGEARVWLHNMFIYFHCPVFFYHHLPANRRCENLMRTYLLQVRKRTGRSDVELADRFWVERFAHFRHGEWSMCLGKSWKIGRLMLSILGTSS